MNGNVVVCNTIDTAFQHRWKADDINEKHLPFLLFCENNENAKMKLNEMHYETGWNKQVKTFTNEV